MPDHEELGSSTLPQGSGDMTPPLLERLLHELGRRDARIMLEADSPPVVLDRFHVVRRIGAGGMGAVFEAWDPKLDRSVALKICRSTNSRSTEHEARCLARLAHPNVVAVHEVVAIADEVVLVMEFVQGRTLREWQRATRPSWRELLDRQLDAGRGLAAAHAAKLEHGDFKPDNVMISAKGRVLVIDFGLARVSAGFEPSESADQRGTLPYMAPERLEGEPGDARADLYSFCVSVWESLYRKRPYDGSTGFALLDSIAAGKPNRGHALPGVPEELRAVLSKGLSKQANQRQRDMDTLLAELREASEAPRRRRQRRWRVGVIGLVAASVSMAWWVEDRREPAMLEAPLEPRPDPVALTLALADEALSEGLPDSTIEFLELARLRAHADHDPHARRAVAVEAERLGTALNDQGDEARAGKCWSIAYEIYVELDDAESVARLQRALETESLLRSPLRRNK
ncbi:serine/threonine-protein kinase [Nannocystaceae bacterium ST9]